MNGVILIDKEKDYTSRDVINVLEKKLHTKKIGHTGTLDPLATGVMVICVGKYTKLVEVLTSTNKTYEATVLMGKLTDTLDSTGNLIKEENVKISKEDIIDCLNKFPRVYDQKVPIYSAVKINGMKLYEYARNGIDVDIPSRKVNINSLELISDIEYINNKTIFKIRCNVSKGTYIRSLINDIASSLNTIGIMTDLKRINQGIFSIESCHKLDEITENNPCFIDDNLLFNEYKVVDINDIFYESIKNGKVINNNFGANKVVFRHNNEYVSIYKEYEKDKNKMKPWKML